MNEQANGGARGGLTAIQRPVAWLDDDERHVWTAHDCRGEWTVVMLPHPQWHAMGSSDDRLIWMHPSFHCRQCLMHEFLPIVATTPPQSRRLVRLTEEA